ncbi:MAG: hypothetical protein KH111_11330 [Bacteroidales bacterium]|nr:hypothetical protein [Bacteroidales bacterium]
MLKNMYWIWVLALLGFMSCADNDNVGKVERVDLLDFDFPQGNDPWDKEIEQIAKDWGMYIIYKDVDSTHLNRRWTTPVETAPIYVCTTPSSDDIQVYLQLVKDWLLSGMDKDNEADREQLPIYLYLVNDFNDGNPKSSSYMKNHIQLKKDGMDYWSLSFTSEELAAGLTPKMIHGVACSFSYPGMKSRFTTGVYKVAPGFLEMTDYETRIGTRYCSKEQFLEENPGIPEVWYDENTGICLYEKDPENAYLRRGFAPQITETFEVVDREKSLTRGAPTWMPWILQVNKYGVERDDNPGPVAETVEERVIWDFLNVIRMAMLWPEEKVREEFPVDAEDPLDRAGFQKINDKYDLVVEYMKTTYNIDLQKYAEILNE